MTYRRSLEDGYYWYHDGAKWHVIQVVKGLGYECGDDLGIRVSTYKNSGVFGSRIKPPTEPSDE